MQIQHSLASTQISISKLINNIFNHKINNCFSSLQIYHKTMFSSKKILEKVNYHKVFNKYHTLIKIKFISNISKFKIRIFNNNNNTFKKNQFKFQT